MAIQRLKSAPPRTNKQALQTLKPDPLLPKGYLSKSAIETYQRCPKQYEFSYILGIKSPPGVAMVEGSAHGEALNHNNLHYMKKAKNLDVKIVVERFKDEFSTRAKDIPKLEWAASGESANSVYRRGERLLDLYMDKFAPRVKPTGVEERIEVMMGGVPVLGFIDLLEAVPLWDYKVVGKAYTQNEADADLQFSIYTKAKKRSVGGFICLTKNSSDIRVIKTERGPGDFKAADELVKSVSDAIKKGAFPMCNPKSWNCSRRFCGYWHQCRGKMLRG